ncbi:uncharacterized protein BXZ73DRAFT_47155 [Epithele typhae]|uniref:uncharacterized protein n=1 Tax=Epithele typhae TaxID=378194 RepID=UPI0020071FF7|nr:uncharacterized protein BXZ73DRAFT_47155 [Epithele typhae]KAH9931648.1 hypothetical protein BXZ73DRAFT_47155 [Epithele typhae]
MIPRPLQARRSRPLSAIFIGSAGSTPPTLPDLPEPPSPSTSSNASGLPSPPATNSTGSGSVGDRSTSAGSIRHRTPGSKPTPSMSGGLGDKTHHRKRSSVIEDDDNPDDNENDEDHTARLSDDRRKSNGKGDNQDALLRVKSLTQRNRMVLDKLSSISRIGSPAPSSASRSPLSPPLGSSSSSATSSSSRVVSGTQPRPPSALTSSTNARRRSTQLSGSETEREGQTTSTYSASSDGNTTPPPLFTPPEPRGTLSVRQRRISAPASPGKARTAAAARERERGSPGPSRTPRTKRVSVTLSVDEGYANRPDDDDVTAAALEAVASSRRSPTQKKGRQPLPREFRERKISDEKVRIMIIKSPMVEPATPHRVTNRSELGRASPSPRKTRISTSDPPGSPRRLGQARYSTVRELTRKHQIRWMSEDLSSPSQDFALESGVGRRNGQRSGSGEGMSGTMGRSVVGEGLKAAGLAKRRDDDVFSSNGSGPSSRRNRSSHKSFAGEDDVSFEYDEGTRVEGVGLPLNPKTPINASHRLRPSSTIGTRPGTSMAALNGDDAPPRTAPPALRSYKSSYALPDRVAELAQPTPIGRSSPFSTVRSSTAQSGARDGSSDHRRLMMEALTMFESQLSRFPPMGQTTTSTIPEVFQSAQHLVHSLDKLNAMLKEGTNKALDAQIDAELADGQGGVDLSELWREVGADHRENLRISDEVVRNMTGFLLGVGKILRDTTSSNQHLRTMSLDEDITRRMTPDVQAFNGHDSDSRRSREIRHSWEPDNESARLRARLTSLERANGSMRLRPGSALNLGRSSATTSSSEERSNAGANDGTPATVRQSAPISGPTSVARRLYTPRERVDSVVSTFSPDRMEPPDYEPSPTPSTRQGMNVSNRRAFPSIAVPPSLSTLPSESLIATGSHSGSDKSKARKISVSSTQTVRAEPSPFSSIKPSNPTTALTHTTVSTSPENSTAAKPFPMLRNDSGSSARSNGGVTFSRATMSSAVHGLKAQQDRNGGSRSRNVSMRSAFADEGVSRPRASLESSRGDESPVDAVRRSLATTVSYSAARKERRRTITEIFTQR